MVIIKSFNQPESPLLYLEHNVKAVLNSDQLGTGSLYINQSTLSWQLNDSIGFSVGYKDISLHAISKDRSVHAEDCLYLVIDTHFRLTNEPPRNEEEDSSDCESTADISELIFVPQNQNSLQQMYESIKQCQALNPDSDDLADDSEEDNIYEDAEEIEEEQFYDGRNVNDADMDALSRRLHANSVNINAHINSETANGNINDEEFEDAD